MSYTSSSSSSAYIGNRSFHVRFEIRTTPSAPARDRDVVTPNRVYNGTDFCHYKPASGYLFKGISDGLTCLVKANDMDKWYGTAASWTTRAVSVTACAFTWLFAATECSLSGVVGVGLLLTSKYILKDNATLEKYKIQTLGYFLETLIISACGFFSMFFKPEKCFASYTNNLAAATIINVWSNAPFLFANLNIANENAGEEIKQILGDYYNNYLKTNIKNILSSYTNEYKIDAKETIRELPATILAYIQTLQKTYEEQIQYYTIAFTSKLYEIAKEGKASEGLLDWITRLTPENIYNMEYWKEASNYVLEFRNVFYTNVSADTNFCITTLDMNLVKYQDELVQLIKQSCNELCEDNADLRTKLEDSDSELLFVIQDLAQLKEIQHSNNRCPETIVKTIHVNGEDKVITRVDALEEAKQAYAKLNDKQQNALKARVMFVGDKAPALDKDCAEVYAKLKGLSEQLTQGDLLKKSYLYPFRASENIQDKTETKSLFGETLNQVKKDLGIAIE